MTQIADRDPSSGQRPSTHCPYHYRISAIFAWIVIITSVAVIITLNRVSSEQVRAESKDLLSPNVPLEITAHYAIGTTSFLKHAARQKSATDPATVYLQQLDTIAKSTPDHLRVAIVAGELSGAAAALQRLDALGPALHSPQLEADATALRSIYASAGQSPGGEIRKRLVDRYAWFGRLALGFGKTSDDPDRQAVMQSAQRAVIVMLVVGFVAFFAFIGGIVLAIVALVHIADGKIRRAYLPVVTPTVPFLEAFAIYLALMITVSSLIGRFSGHLTLNVAYLLAGCVPVATALVWPLFRGITWSQLRHGLGWHAGTGVFREMFWGIVGYIAGLPLLVIGAIATLILSKKSGAQTAHPIINQAAGAGSALRLFLLASVFAPLAEESLFRGALFHHLRGRHAWWFSALIVSLIFAAIHPQGWAAIPPLAMIAITLCAIREWRGTIVASATAHALNNGVIMLVLVIGTS